MTGSFGVFAAAANASAPINVAQNVGFGIIAALMVWAAIRVVTTRNVVHAALWLVLVLAGAAAQFLLLAAEFVALVQVLVYIGAIIVLFLFGIMLTKAPIGGEANLTRKTWIGGAAVGVMMFGLLAFALLDTFGSDRLPTERALTLRPAAVSQFEARTGIVTAGMDDEELLAAVDALDDVTDAERETLRTTATAIATPNSAIDTNTGAVSDAIFGDYLLPFEAIGVLLTAALIGAIVLARKE